MKTKLITLENSFHNTSVRVRVPVDCDSHDAWVMMSKRAQARVRRILCGADKGNCTCGVVRMSVRYSELDRGEDHD